MKPNESDETADLITRPEEASASPDPVVGSDAPPPQSTGLTVGPTGLLSPLYSDDETPVRVVAEQAPRRQPPLPLA